MNQRISNPFTSVWLQYPAEQRPDYERFCQTDNPSPLDSSPFPRRVDMWFAALSIAIRKGLPPVDLSTHKTLSFVEGQIFDRDPWRIRALMLVALSVDRTIDVVNDPSRMMSIANGLAAGGAPLIVGMLSEGEDRHIWNLSEAIQKLLDSDQA